MDEAIKFLASHNKWAYVHAISEESDREDASIMEIAVSCKSCRFMFAVYTSIIGDTPFNVRGEIQNEH